MKCNKCSNESIYHTTQYCFCKGHFNEYFIAKIQKIIKKYNILKKQKILIAYSGGKDSSSVKYVFQKLGFNNIKAIYIKLDFDFFKEQNETIKKQNDIEIIDIAKEYKISTYEIKFSSSKSYCRICSTIKRYFLNKYAFENGYDIIATGHNMSDITTSALLNIKNSFLLGFTNLSPYLSPKKEYKLVSRIKPLFLLTDREVKKFTEINNIISINQKCIHSKNDIFKKAIQVIEENDYQSLEKISYTLIEFSKKISDYAQYSNIKTNLCSKCGYPSASEICSFCKLIITKD
ncbi:MAG: hypothetical protein N2Z20_02315 [Elusimicrobiales bacterium]|nr:hypothetical protein [Elusimicrobiales bacterium]